MLLYHNYNLYENMFFFFFCITVNYFGDNVQKKKHEYLIIHKIICNYIEIKYYWIRGNKNIITSNFIIIRLG